MTYEQILEELKRLKMHTDPGKGEHEVDVSKEVAEIDASIEDYNEKIAKLEAKIADESNYQYNSENEERDLTIEILEESFENQLEVMAREDEEYNTLRELATNIFDEYNLEIATLNDEIATTERRLRKNDIAVSKNIGIRLNDEELSTLNSDLERKRARIQECEEMQTKYVEDLRGYTALTMANAQKRDIVLSKQESLNKIKENRASKVGTIDNAKLRIDKDELASLKAGLAALNSRKDYITYNPNAEIDKLIEAIEQNKEVVEENTDLSAGVVASVIDQDNQIKPEENLENTVNDKSQRLIDSYLAGTANLSDESEKLAEETEKEDFVSNEPLGIPEETTAHDIWVAGNTDLDEEREAEIEEAAEILKEKKKEGWFKRHWKKFVAAGLATIAMFAALKGCDSDTKEVTPSNNTNDNSSHSQTDEGIIEQNQQDIDDKYEIPGDNDLEEENSNQLNPSTPSQTPQSTPETTPELEPTPEPEVEPTPNPVPDPVPDSTPEPTVGTGEIQLEVGEKVISENDLINGNLSEDTIIQHGDEVGKTTANAELKDYTEEGKAVVEYEKNNVITENSNDREQIIKNLEQFMGGEITFTDEGNQWLDEMSGKTRR